MLFVTVSLLKLIFKKYQTADRIYFKILKEKENAVQIMKILGCDFFFKLETLDNSHKTTVDVFPK